jgi:hypothetical protein
MQTTLPILTSQIQRLLISEADKSRLLDELKSLNESKMQQFAELIREHDDEALKILDAKSEEQEKEKQNLLNQPFAQKNDVNESVGRAFIQDLEVVFNDSRKLAEFIALSDDRFLRKLETVFINALRSQSEAKEEFQQFFREVRLQKASFAKEKQGKEKKKLMEAIEKTQEQNKKLDALIAKVEGVLKNA